MRSLRSAAAVAVAVLVLVSAQTAGAAPILLAGTYNAGTPGTSRPQRTGNELVLAHAANDRLAFGLNAIRLSDNNTGYISGKLRAGNNVVWIASGNGVRCRLRFVAASDTTIRVTQDARFGDCGFGYGVVADGLYVRTRSTGKIRPWNGP